MNHLAFRRDTADEQLVVQFAVQVGSPELLQMLYVLTAADLGAVGPGVWDGWKAEVVTDLYHRTMQHLAGDAPASDIGRTAGAAPRGGASRLSGTDRRPPGSPPARRAAAAYPSTRRPQRIAADLRLLHGLAAGDVHAAGRYLSESRHGPIHRRHSRADHARHLPQAHRRPDQPRPANPLGPDQHPGRRPGARPLLGHDPDYAEAPPPERLEQVEPALVESLRAPHDAPPGVPPGVAQRARAAIGRRSPAAHAGAHRQQHLRPLHDHRRLHPRPPGPAVHDHPHAVRAGLVGLGRRSARISTRWSTCSTSPTRQGRKITTSERLQQISDGLLGAINAMGDD